MGRKPRLKPIPASSIGLANGKNLRPLEAALASRCLVSAWFWTVALSGALSMTVLFAWQGASKKRESLRHAGQYSFWVFPLERLAAGAWWSINATFLILVTVSFSLWPFR